MLKSIAGESGIIRRPLRYYFYLLHVQLLMEEEENWGGGAGGGGARPGRRRKRKQADRGKRRLYCIIYRYLYRTSHSVSQTEYFSSRKKVRLKTRERRGKRRRENNWGKRRKEAIPEWRTNRSKGPGVGHGCPNTRHEKIMALGRAERAERQRWMTYTVGR